MHTVLYLGVKSFEIHDRISQRHRNRIRNEISTLYHGPGWIESGKNRGRTSIDKHTPSKVPLN